MVCEQLEQAKRNYPRAHLMQGLKARRAALARAVRDAAATESAAMSAQRRGFQEALFYLQASGSGGRGDVRRLRRAGLQREWRSVAGAARRLLRRSQVSHLLDLPGHGLRW
jgi:hypothetical protein